MGTSASLNWEFGLWNHDGVYLSLATCSIGQLKCEVPSVGWSYTHSDFDIGF